MRDAGLRPVVVAVIHDPLNDARGHDAGAADQHGARPAAQFLVHVIMWLVGVDDPRKVLVFLAVVLQVVEESNARVPDSEVHKAAAIGNAACSPGGGLGRVDDQIAATVTAPHGSHHTLLDHGRPTDAFHLSSH